MSWLRRLLIGRARYDEWVALARAEVDARNSRRCSGECVVCDYLDSLSRCASDNLARAAAEARDEHFAKEGVS